MTEPKASEKADFDQLLKDFYDVISELEQCMSPLRCTCVSSVILRASCIGVCFVQNYVEQC